MTLRRFVTIDYILHGVVHSAAIEVCNNPPKQRHIAIYTILSHCAIWGQNNHPSLIGIPIRRMHTKFCSNLLSFAIVGDLIEDNTCPILN